MNWLIETTVYLSITAIILLAFKKLFKNKLSARVQFVIWGLLLIRFLIPYLPESKMSVYNNIPSYTSISVQPGNNTVYNTKDNIENIMPQTEIAENNSNKLNAENIMMTIWAIGAVSLFLYFVLTYISFLFSLKKYKNITDEETLDILSECKNITGIKRNIKILSGGDTPLLKGIINPAIILPEGYTISEKKDVFLHELCHLKHFDIPFTWLAVIFVCFNWFNPIIWYSFFAFRRDIEVYCDERTLKYSSGKKEYAILLLKTALKKNKFLLGTTAFQNGEKEVQRRIRHIAYFKKPTFIWCAVIFAVAAIICVVCLTNRLQNKTYDTTAIVINDTSLYLDADLNVPSYSVNQNDVVSIIKNNSDEVYYVQLPIMEIPPVCGYIKADDVSFNAKDFTNARYATIENATVYNSENNEDIYSQSESGIINIQNYGKDFVKCSLTGGVDDKYVKKSDINYEISSDDSLYALASQYLSDEFFRVYSPYYEILNLYISNWEQDSNSATFFYTMTHKNFDKDPDTVEYIKEAKENGSTYYEQLKKEYLEPKEANYEFKVIYDNNKLELYTNIDPKGFEWVPTTIDDFIMN